ncbi:diaminopimelate epimerase [Propionicicella superfundia]|uniref:diaminopimelate epimerase n=1 Tax=Propionicicella superfundia TaxID=348582 RepID=UPI0004227C15|nr:diaminopimelate epimerase [Propionicicella superfundia]
MRQLSFAKGHGAKNDFVIVLDRHGVSPLSEEDVRFVCDRHVGVGGDGLLRVIKAAHVCGWDGDPHLWFMDYRNADGSLAEMCGNGLRVFARFLQEEDLIAENTITIATRAGARQVVLRGDGLIQVEMGPARISPEEASVSVSGETRPAVAVNVGNPHAVTFVDGATLAGLDLRSAPGVGPADLFPDGTNVEFVHVLGEHDIAMRVHERGVGETMACGTGMVAAVAAVDARNGAAGGAYTVRVPGGVLTVELGNGLAWLTGPAVIVARGEVTLPDRR